MSRGAASRRCTRRLPRPLARRPSRLAVCASALASRRHPMNTGGSPDHALLDLPEDAPIVLVGEPKSLRGELRLHNRGDEKMVVREARVRSAPLLEATSGRVGPVAQAVLSAILQPG